MLRFISASVVGITNISGREDESSREGCRGASRLANQRCAVTYSIEEVDDVRANQSAGIFAWFFLSFRWCSRNSSWGWKKTKKKKNCVKDGVRSAVEGSSVALNPGLLGSSVEATPAWNASAC